LDNKSVVKECLHFVWVAGKISVLILPLYNVVEPRVAASGECGGGLGAVAPAVGDDGPQQVAVGLLPTCPVNSVAESLIAVEVKPVLLLLPLMLLAVPVLIIGLVLIFSSARSGQG
uniref:Uncharacterized protein n=1 Tax=Glossina palpalis gambiensis TaxID=67801 RepID=A0A1B0BFN8_9MUSC